MRVPRSWLVAGLCVATVGVLALALGPKFSFGWILVLLCPLSHFLMMGSRGHGGEGTADGHRHRQEEAAGGCRGGHGGKDPRDGTEGQAREVHG